jgi:hypothetical protein
MPTAPAAATVMAGVCASRHHGSGLTNDPVRHESTAHTPAVLGFHSNETGGSLALNRKTYQPLGLAPTAVAQRICPYEFAGGADIQPMILSARATTSSGIVIPSFAPCQHWRMSSSAR